MVIVFHIATVDWMTYLLKPPIILRITPTLGLATVSTFCNKSYVKIVFIPMRTFFTAFLLSSLFFSLIWEITQFITSSRDTLTYFKKRFVWKNITYWTQFYFSHIPQLCVVKEILVILSFAEEISLIHLWFGNLGLFYNQQQI